MTVSLEKFREDVVERGSYRSSRETLAPIARKPGWWTTFSFSWSVFVVFPFCAIREFFRSLTVEVWARQCFKTVQKAEKFGIPVLLDGWENRANHKGPVVYLANHMSTLETIMLPPVLLAFGPINIFVKASLSHLPCLEKAAAHMGLIPLSRKSPREDLMQVFTRGVEQIKAGHSILIFPQGSRERVFSRKAYSSIGAKLAEKAGVPVVPIALKTDCEPTRPDGKGWFKDFGTVDPSKDVRIRCGAPIVGKARDVHEKVFAWIKAQLDEWGLPTDDAR
ncbi:MAG: 1-acyl-sn-glycerol-3-phosphate acyltransferase [Kiritimatiellae bacterium]|nr:1-acyl-sn-glycerol-3-phosphate acyltransferase [Kiritimatiellia bacterium]